MKLLCNHPLVATALASVIVLGCAAEPPPPADVGAPKLILVIGDGMDDQQITIARNYLVGNGGRLTLDELPFRGAALPQTLDEDDPSRPVYVADSANTATAMATGVLTSQGRIATTAQTDRDLTTIMEMAQAAGIGTGVVTTSSVTDATVAAFMAHISQRFCQGPSDMESTPSLLQRSINCSADYKRNGGAGSISEQIAASALDIVLGGGTQYFEQVAEGEEELTVLELARRHGFHVVLDVDGLRAAPPGERMLGLFSPSTMPVAMRASGGGEAQRVEEHDGKVRVPAAFACEADPMFEGLPTLAEMTAVALDRFETDRGFMLVVESASIDKQSHARRPCGHIGELDQLDEAVAVALDYADAHPETLIVVTADHTHAAQIIAVSSELSGINRTSPGYVARVRTPEGGIMGINYATNTGSMELHTGAQVPVFASGMGADELPRFMTQADIFHIAAGHLGLATEHP